MDFQPSLESGMKHRVYWIAKRVTQGQFATPDRAAVLRDQGVTHVLNVGEGGSIIDAADFGFSGIVDVPMIDLQLIPTDIALRAVDALHEMLAEPNSIAFIHCIAVQNRSPTILWLYFVACGVPSDVARDLVANRSPDAVPGHGRLVDATLVHNVRSHGKSNYIPIADQSILEPAY